MSNNKDFTEDIFNYEKKICPSDDDIAELEYSFGKRCFFPWPELSIDDKDFIKKGFKVFNLQLMNTFQNMLVSHNNLKENSSCQNVAVNPYFYKKSEKTFFTVIDENPQLKIFLSLIENFKLNAELFLDNNFLICPDYGLILLERNVRNSIEAFLDLYIILAESLNDKTSDTEYKLASETFYYKILLFSSTYSNDPDIYTYRMTQEDLNFFKNDFKKYKNRSIYELTNYDKKTNKRYDSNIKKAINFMISSKNSNKNNFIIPFKEKCIIAKKYLRKDSLSDFNIFLSKEYEAKDPKTKEIKPKDFLDIIIDNYYNVFNNAVHPNIFFNLFLSNPDLNKGDFYYSDGAFNIHGKEYSKKISSKFLDILSFESKLIFISMNLINYSLKKSFLFQYSKYKNMSNSFEQLECRVGFQEREINPLKDQIILSIPDDFASILFGEDVSYYLKEKFNILTDSLKEVVEESGELNLDYNSTLFLAENLGPDFIAEIVANIINHYTKLYPQINNISKNMDSIDYINHFMDYYDIFLKARKCKLPKDNYAYKETINLCYNELLLSAKLDGIVSNTFDTFEFCFKLFDIYIRVKLRFVNKKNHKDYIENQFPSYTPDEIDKKTYWKSRFYKRNQE